MLSTLSVFAGRRFHFPFGPINFYPNLYVVLVGDPGTGKSTALNRAKEIVRESAVCPIGASQITKEALTLKMSSTIDGQPKKTPFLGQRFFHQDNRMIEYNQYAIFATELTQFIGVNPQGFLEFLTAVWDEPVVEVETKHKGSDYVVGPYITVLACMTPELVKGYLKMNILVGGFARRTAFIYTNTKNIVHWPEFSAEQQAARDRCIEFGRRLQDKSGAFSCSPTLKTFYEEWNQKNEEELPERAPNMRGWFESKGEMLWKLSMLVSLSEHEGKNLVLEVPHYKIALRWCELVERDLHRVFEGTGINPNAQAVAQVCRMLEGLGKPMALKTIKAMFYDNVTDMTMFDDMLKSMCTVGRLERRTISTDNQILGEVIGAPGTIEKHSAAELAQILLRPSMPAPVRNMDSSP